MPWPPERLGCAVCRCSPAGRISSCRVRRPDERERARTARVEGYRRGVRWKNKVSRGSSAATSRCSRSNGRRRPRGGRSCHVTSIIGRGLRSALQISSTTTPHPQDTPHLGSLVCFAVIVCQEVHLENTLLEMKLTLVASAIAASNAAPAAPPACRDGRTSTPSMLFGGGGGRRGAAGGMGNMMEAIKKAQAVGVKVRSCRNCRDRDRGRGSQQQYYGRVSSAGAVSVESPTSCSRRDQTHSAVSAAAKMRTPTAWSTPNTQRAISESRRCHAMRCSTSLYISLVSDTPFHILANSPHAGRRQCRLTRAPEDDGGFVDMTVRGGDLTC